MKLNTLITAMSIGFGACAFAQAPGPVRIGFITDMSSLYADIDGPAGGEILHQGPLAGLFKVRRSPTAPYLRTKLGR